MPVKLYVGGATNRTQGELQDLGGYRCFSPRLPKNYPQSSEAIAILDCGHNFRANQPTLRLDCDEVLERQFKWEATAAKRLGVDWQAEAFASYDDLVPWKSPCDMGDGFEAIYNTILGARYLDKQRKHVKPRHLLLGVQGSHPEQYQFCLEEILPYTLKNDWIGFGGWRHLGNHTTQLPIFYETIHRCVPLVGQAGIRRIHLFGVLREEAVAPLLWLCDQHGIDLSVDNNRPILNCLRSDLRRSGALAPYWRDNVQLWHERCTLMRQSPHYAEPARLPHQQFTFWTLNKSSEVTAVEPFNLLQASVQEPEILIDGYRSDDPRNWVILLRLPLNLDAALNAYIHWSKPASHLEVSFRGIDSLAPLAAEALVATTGKLQQELKQPVIYTHLERCVADALKTAIAKLNIPHWLSLAGEEFIYLAHQLPDEVASLLPHLATPKGADDLVGILTIPRSDLVTRLQKLWKLGLLLRRRVERCNGSNEFFYCYQLPAHAQFKVWEVACVAN